LKIVCRADSSALKKTTVALNVLSADELAEEQQKPKRPWRSNLIHVVETRLQRSSGLLPAFRAAK
jgi:hypothetical protein